ncbi:S-layer homology domain-containing protein [Tissierella praeacuta]|uniref:S-layer homology domain-containing protein n=1 Tax=Tissierella praeacuta TaxID=43131 RepID=UPI0033419961
MKNYENLKRGVTTALVSAILVSSIPSYGAAPRFKDVPTTYWGYTYIEDMASRGYIKGIGDGSKFAPDGSLNFDAAMSLLARLSNPTSTERANASYAYSALLNELKIDDWAKEGLAVCLYKNIITEQELRNVHKKGQIKKTINKVNTCEYLVKAMGLDDVAKNKQIVSLTYKDVMSMSAMQSKYVSVLIDAGVLDPKGAGDGTFKPNSTLTRAVMAKMMSTADEFIKKNGTTSPTNPTNPDNSKTEIDVVSGKVVNTYSESSKRFLTIENSRGSETTYEIMSSTTIVVDGKQTNYSDLSEGQEIELKLKKDTKNLISVNATSQDEYISGKIKYINTLTSKITIEYTEGKKTLYKEFSIDKNADIYLNGKSVYLNNLNEKDLIDVKIKKGLIYDIESQSKDMEIKGTIKDITPVKDSKDDEYYITILDSKDKSYKFLINRKTDITRNRKSADAEDLKVKDEVYIEAEYDIAKEIEATVDKKDIKGIILGMETKLQEPTKITILNQKTKKEEKYSLGKVAHIKVDRSVATSYDLKAGFSVEIVVEGDEIIEIEADSIGVSATMVGRVLGVNSRKKTLDLEITDFSLDSSKFGEEITVYSEDVVVLDERGNKLDFSHLYKGDIINIIGSYDGSTFIAKTIILLR